MKGRGNGGLNNNCGRLLDGAMESLPERNGEHMTSGMIGFCMGLFIGTFAGVFLLGLMQMIKEGDQKNEKLDMERRGKIGSGKFRKPDDYHSYFIADRRRGVHPDGGAEP
jgi:hypothetical protein